MPLGYECRQKLIKQNPPKPTTPRLGSRGTLEPPGPFHYEAPELIGGKGFSKIKRAPAYTFGEKTAIMTGKPPTKPNAPVFNISSMVRKGGPRKIINGPMGLKLDTNQFSTIGPGPAAYQPVKMEKVVRRPPAYTMQPPAKVSGANPCMWTPGPNMYWPPIPGKKAPAYTFSANKPKADPRPLPGPGEYDPKFNYVKKTKQEYTMMGARRDAPIPNNPAPNTYCQHKFNYPLKKGTAPSFGIRHSPYLGVTPTHLKSSKTDVLAG